MTRDQGAEYLPLFRKYSLSYYSIRYAGCTPPRSGYGLKMGQDTCQILPLSRTGILLGTCLPALHQTTSYPPLAMTIGEPLATFLPPSRTPVEPYQCCPG